jgi:hypothetical protein
MFKNYLNGFEYCMASKRKVLREHKSEHFRERLQAAHTIFKVSQRFAPNQSVGEMAAEADRRLAKNIGPPSPEIESATDNVLAIVEAFAREQASQPQPPPPRTFPCKRYVYDGRGDELGRPFRVEYDLVSV